MRASVLLVSMFLVACGQVPSPQGDGGGRDAGPSADAGAGGGAGGDAGLTDAGIGAGGGGGGATGLPDAGGAGGGGGTSPAFDAGAMVEVSAGVFTMGCATCDADEAPVRQVTLARFDIDLTEVTQAAYAVCVAEGGCTPPSANFDPVGKGYFPVVNVSWDQAAAFCAFAGKRLPTEAEWEKAARGTDGRTFPWGNGAADCVLANTASCALGVEAVGQHPAGASPTGALDMAGNVWEWTADFYDAAYYATAPLVDPPGPATGTQRTYRGGSAGNDANLARTSNRASTYSPAVGGSGLGFRCAR